MYLFMAIDYLVYKRYVKWWTLFDKGIIDVLICKTVKC